MQSLWLLNPHSWFGLFLGRRADRLSAQRANSILGSRISNLSKWRRVTTLGASGPGKTIVDSDEKQTSVCVDPVVQLASANDRPQSRAGTRACGSSAIAVRWTFRHEKAFTSECC